MQQSVSLLKVKDPLFKRMGASRLARFAIDGKDLFFLLYEIIDKFGDCLWNASDSIILVCY